MNTAFRATPPPEKRSNNKGFEELGKDTLSLLHKVKNVILKRQSTNSGILSLFQNLSFCEMTATGKRVAFTLTEALITVITIGIIAILVLPSFNAEMSQTVLNSQKKIFYGNFNQALHRMRVDGSLSESYGTTIAFVSELSKHIRIDKICNSEHLKSCFSQPITTEEGSILYPESLRSSQSLASNSFNSELVGIKFADGASAIIGYNPDCRLTEIYDIGADVTRCLIMIYDVNSEKKPNKIGTDRETINISEDGLGWDISNAFHITPLTKAQCEEIFAGKKAPIQYSCNHDKDYWAAAMYKCYTEEPVGSKRLPTPDEMGEIASQLYGESVQSGYGSNLTIKDKKLWQKLGNQDSYVWTSLEASGSEAYTHAFLSNSTARYRTGRDYVLFYRSFCVKNK